MTFYLCGVITQLFIFFFGCGLFDCKVRPTAGIFPDVRLFPFSRMPEYVHIFLIKKRDVLLCGKPINGIGGQGVKGRSI